jgi:hypothetical protein
MVTESSSSKKSKSSVLRMDAAVRSSGGRSDHVLKARCARRKISSTLALVFRFFRRPSDWPS